MFGRNLVIGSLSIDKTFPMKASTNNFIKKRLASTNQHQFLRNPVEQASIFYNSILKILTEIEFTGRTERELKACQEKAAEICVIIEEINTNVVSLDAIIPQSRFRENLEFWEAQEAGLIAHKDLVPLRYHSKILETLYRKGFDITKVYKFSPIEDEIARVMGSINTSNAIIINNIKRQYDITNDDMGSLEFSYQIKNKIFKLIGIFERKGLIVEPPIYYRYEKEEQTWVPIKKEDFSKNYRYNVDFKKQLNNEARKYSNGNIKQFVTGDWFNSWIYQVTIDHLKRNLFDFEIYTKVEFTTPFDIAKSSGDFDIIAMVENKILCIECKSKNKISVEDGDKLIRKTREISTIFHDSNQSLEYEFLLVHLEKTKIPDTLFDKLLKNKIYPVMVNQLRYRLNDIFPT